MLTPANVSSGQFGKLFTTSVDGWVYAQPLYMANVSIGGATHNVLYVATQNGTLFAIDADNGANRYRYKACPVSNAGWASASSPITWLTSAVSSAITGFRF